jgi:hypothetical protein
MKIAKKVRKFTGYTIKENYDLNNLKKYGFTKTEPKDINPWWQRPFDTDWSGFFGTWRSELLISKEDRRLLAKYEENANLDRLNEALQEMINDGVFEESEGKDEVQYS